MGEARGYDIQSVAGHYAISSLFENYSEKTRVYCYEVDRLKYRWRRKGRCGWPWEALAFARQSPARIRGVTSEFCISATTT